MTEEEKFGAMASLWPLNVISVSEARKLLSFAMIDEGALEFKIKYFEAIGDSETTEKYRAEGLWLHFTQRLMVYTLV